MRRILMLSLLAFLAAGAAPLAAGAQDGTPIYNCGSLLDGSYPDCCPPQYLAPVTCRPRSPLE